MLYIVYLKKNILFNYKDKCNIYFIFLFVVVFFYKLYVIYVCVFLFEEKRDF